MLTVRQSVIAGKISLILSIAKVLEAKLQLLIDQRIIDQKKFEKS